MALEVLLEKAYNVAVHWWSLGIVVSQMSSGHSLFYNGATKQTVYMSTTTKEAKFPAWLEVDLKHLIKKLLRKSPERHLSVREHQRPPMFRAYLVGGTRGEEDRAAFYTFPSCSGVLHATTFTCEITFLILTKRTRDS
ncbi:unnamed protein product [Ranitomeya imitator]|uniref:Protein kinase domain-containing protein n=1 Tax=Ranitomeya imitator TaxID=111125 RepID=A0ABN9M2S8_9NEOB|nr:unnamed protein product [Ranitomeya imitator]